VFSESDSDSEPESRKRATETAPRAGGGAAATPIASPHRKLAFIDDDDATLGGTPNHRAQRDSEDNLSMKIKNYVLWEPLPDDHVVSDVGHPTKGCNRIAYQNWKKINTGLSDQAKPSKGGPSRLGPLTNALTTEMRASVGNVLSKYPEVHPRPSMSDDDIRAWLRKDTAYEWVTKVNDATLIKLLDAHFSVLDPDPFLTMRFPANIPKVLPNGNPNYCAISHDTFAEKWLNRLADLRKGGWDESMTDLKQTYINALASNSILHGEASRYFTTSYELLISHMRQWTYQKWSQQQATDQQREQLSSESTAKEAPPATPASTTTPASPRVDKGVTQKEVKALRTELLQMKQQLQQRDQGGAAAGGGATAGGAASNDKTPFYCNGCGLTYSRDGRKVPCEQNCVFAEHAEHNKNYKAGTPWPQGKPKLTWGTPEEYKRKYGIEMPARGQQYLEMRAKYKRKREEARTSNA